MINGREIPLEELRVVQQRTAGNEWLLPASGQAPRMSHNRGVRIFTYLESHDRIIIQQRRSRTEFGRVQLADIVVEEEQSRPPAHTADQQAQVALPADVERGGRYTTLDQRHA